ncbi:MAG: 16S rRNA (adenine(1518)-N(6)/adenine(1519)-N(6))-dimethyltransferase RsmA [Flavihumibacter sp.]
MYTLKKSLGQHFLRDDSYCRKITEALQALPFQRLLEVGPGGGALTKYLLDLPGVDFRAVELDDEKIGFLEKTYPSIGGKLIHQSVLDMDAPFAAPFTVVGNFPYNISTQILFKILDWGDQVQSVTGMFQKEVAERVAAAPGSKTYGVISVLIQAGYRVEYLFDVPPGAFQPPPKVMSGVIRLLPTASPPMKSRAAFNLLVKTAFNQRRKTLRNATRGLFSPEVLAESLFDQRAERLSVADFAALTFKMNP